MADGGKTVFSSGSEIVFDFFCELCIDDNKQVEAEGYCVDCREYLCGFCYNGHRTTRATRHHVLQDKCNMPKDTPLSTDRISKDIITKCKVHSGKTVEYFCKSHDVLGCANCFATDHRKCDDVESVAQKSENILESQCFKEFMSKLQLIQTKSHDIKARARENKTISQRYCTEVVSMVRKLKEEVIEMLNELEQNTVTFAEEMMSVDEERMESVVEDCKVLSEKIENFSFEFESLKSSKRVCQIYVSMRETESDVKKVEDDIGRMEKVNVVRTLTFEPNAKLMSFLRNPDALGTISHHVQQNRTPSQVPTRNTNSIIAKKLEDICIRSTSDTLINCYISGSAVISKNRLVITDWNHKKVKLVDTNTNSLLSELIVSSYLHDITVINKTLAVVTLPCINKILMIKVSPSLTEEREITVRGSCHGIAYSQDRLLVTYEDNPRLEMIDLQGNVIRTIENGSDGSKLFKIPWYVCVSRDGETIFVSDSSRNTVTSLTRDGVVKAVYKDEELRGPRKVCTDHHGNVYVCGSTNMNVHMITADCMKIKVILTQADGLDRSVRSVSHCQDTNRLFIACARDKVKVYQLS